MFLTFKRIGRFVTLGGREYYGVVADGIDFYLDGHAA